MNWKRFKYLFFCLVSLGLAMLLGFGLAEFENAPFQEMLLLVPIVMILAFLMGRDSDREDETAGIISLDDDD